MPGSEEVRDYAFADQMLALRERAGLTQQQLAARIEASRRAIQAWEAGLSYPAVERLRAVIACFLERGAFDVDSAEDEAAALWELVRARAPRRISPFERAWFRALHAPTPVTAMRVDGADVVTSILDTPARWQDWGEAPGGALFYGRAAELGQLSRWIVEERCQTVAVLGMGGIGKTALAARLAQDMASQFQYVYWRSLYNAPRAEEWLAGAIGLLSPQQDARPEGVEAQVEALLDLLQRHRTLLVLDNLEIVFAPGEIGPQYREGYAAYGRILQRLGETRHDGCLLLTSRERPLELGRLDGGGAAVRSLQLGGLGAEDARALLRERDLTGDGDTWLELVTRYAGNPLALKLVGETIAELFGSDIAAFLTEGDAVFGDIRQLLDSQTDRLSAPERRLLTWLAIERLPVTFAELVGDLVPTSMARSAAQEALLSLRRRSLIERGGQGATVSLQPVVQEYMTDRLVDAVAAELLAEQPVLLASHALVKATARDYVRRSQERLIAQPLLDGVVTAWGSTAEAESRLLALLGRWRARPAAEQGYGPGNVVNLLRLLRGHLRGLDLSRLTIRQAYLQEVEAQDTSLAGTCLERSACAEAFRTIYCVALSAQGLHLAAGTIDGELRIWRVTDRTPTLSVQAHTGFVHSVALTADGRLAASAGLDGTVKLWETTPRSEYPARLPRVLRGHAGAVHFVALADDGRLALSGGLDGTLRLWETASGQCLAVMQSHRGLILGVAISADGHLAASGGDDGMIRLWDMTPRMMPTMRESTSLQASGPQGRLLATLQGHAGTVTSVALSADGRLLASGGDDGALRLWETASGRCLATLPGHLGQILSVSVDDDGRLVASGGYDGTVRLWEPSSGRCLATLWAHDGGTLCNTLSADGRLVASGGLDSTIKLWEADSGRLLTRLQGQTGKLLSVARNGNGLVASGGDDGMARLWDIGSGRCLTTLPGHSGAVFGVALSADGQLFASGGADGTVQLWEATPRSATAPSGYLEGSAPSGVSPPAGGPAGGLLAGAVDSEHPLDISWANGPPGRPPVTLRGHRGWVRGLAMSDGGQLVASAGQDGTVRLWERVSAGGPTGRFLATLQGHSGLIFAVGMSGDGRLVAAGGPQESTVRLWGVAPRASTAAAEEIPGRSVMSTASAWAIGSPWEPLAALEGHAGAVFAVAVSADGRLVASGGQDTVVRLWEACSDASQWRPLTSLEGHAGAIFALALSRDGRLVASGATDGTVRLWDVACGRLLATLPSHAGVVFGVALSWDDRSLVSVGDDGLLKVWDVQTGASLRVLRPDRRYERMDITDLTGISEVQKTALIALGAAEEGANRTPDPSTSISQRHTRG
jgi:WD40 repeat protein/transcriptional regulator with XRE-family HTH domain